MAENVRFYANELFSTAEIIVTGHNFHLARHNDNENVMGEMLISTHPRSLGPVNVRTTKVIIWSKRRKEMMITLGLQSPIADLVGRRANCTFAAAADRIAE